MTLKIDCVDANGDAIAAPRAHPNDTTIAPAKDKPTVSAWGHYPQYPAAWMTTFNNQRERARTGKGEVVFVGDSLTQGWGGEGKETWKTKIAALDPVNFGIGGDSTRQVIYRVNNGLLDGLNPKVVVLMIGTNNLYNDFNSGNETEIADGVKASVDAIRAKAPEATPLVLSLLPCQNDYFIGRINKVNSAIASVDDGVKVKYLDVFPAFSEGPGEVKADLFVPDKLHLSAKGYQVLAEQITPTIVEILK